MLSIAPCKSINKPAYRSIRDHEKIVRRGIKRGFNDSKEQIKETAGRLMKEPKSGNYHRVYVSKSGRKLKRSRLHRASRHDEPFAWMSGATFRSIGFKVSIARMQIGLGTMWGAFWERTKRRVLIKAIAKNHNRTAQNIEREIQSGFNKFARANG